MASKACTPLAEIEYKDMSNNTSEALRLARMIENYNAGVESQRIAEDYQQAADELRRLYFENEKLRAALAEQPAQQHEPVVFYRCNGCGHAYEQMHPTSCDCMEAGGFDRVEYYTSPPAQRKPLTDEEIVQLLGGVRESITGNVFFAFARAVERAHGIGEIK